MILYSFGGSPACASSEEALALYKEGNVWAEAKEFRKARAFYRNSIVADPSFALGHNALGYVEYELGHYETAEAEYNEALRLDPNMAVAYNNLGILYYRKNGWWGSPESGYLDKAESYYKKAIELKPDYAKAMVNLSVVYVKKGNLWSAFTTFQQAKDTDINYVNERKNSDNAQKEIKKIEEKYGTVEAK